MEQHFGNKWNAMGLVLLPRSGFISIFHIQVSIIFHVKLIDIFHNINNRVTEKPI